MTFGSRTLAEHPLGPLATQVLQAALHAIEPAALVRAWAERSLLDAGPIRVLALGKAAASMTLGLQNALGDRLVGGTVVTKHPVELAGLDVYTGNHPVPGEDSLHAGTALLKCACEAAPGETVVALVSGGASALAETPAEGLSLEDIIARTRERLHDATPIESLNAQRRTWSRLKGGGLARAVPVGVDVHVAVLSDVLGGGPHAIGSGPFDDPRAQTHLLADNQTAVRAAASAAAAAGAEVEVTPPLRGEARVEGVRWAHARMQAPSTDAVRCTLAGAETVVSVRGDGLGGRNQEFALAAAPPLMGHPHALLASLATDGEDGPTDAAGAAVDGTTVPRALDQGLDPDDFLRRNDAYRFFDPLGDLLRPGPTGTNVCDLVLAFS
jgi:hydroxypyruvate reductase